MDRIDSHQHFWNYHPAKHVWMNDDMAVLKKNYSPHDLEFLLKSCNLNGCVAVQANQAEEENEFLLNLADESKKIKTTFEILYKVAGEDIFKRKFKGQFLESYFEAVAIGVYVNIDSFNPNNEKDIDFLKARVQVLEEQESFTKYKGTGTNSTIRIPNVVSFGKEYFKK